MKHTGIIRRIDDLGRVNIPKNIRAELRLLENDPMEFCIDGENLVLKKYYPAAIGKYLDIVKHTAKVVGLTLGICDKDLYDIETNVKVEGLSAAQLFKMRDSENAIVGILYCKDQCPNEEQYKQIAIVADLLQYLFIEEMGA